MSPRCGDCRHYDVLLTETQSAEMRADNEKHRATFEAGNEAEYQAATRAQRWWAFWRPRPRLRRFVGYTFDHPAHGLCRRHPPQNGAVFPGVQAFDWCGDFEPRTQPLP